MNFPLDLRFKLLAISSQISVRDGMGQLLCYAKQKVFRLKEAVTIFADEAQTHPLYRIDADRIIDISARYRIEDMAGRPIGVVQQRGMRSLWRAHYDVQRDDAPVFTIQEENPWVKVADGFLSQLPLIGVLSGYLFHPAYRVTRSDTGSGALRVVKLPALFEGRYQVESLAAMAEEDARLAVLSVLVMLLLERQRG